MPIQKWPKIFHLGHGLLKKVLEGEVSITEKVDGSQWRIWCDKDGNWDVGSKNVTGYNNVVDGLFEKAKYLSLNFVLPKMKEYIEKNNIDEIEIYVEYLKQPKHNVLVYSRIPKNHFYLWGCWIKKGEKTKFFNDEELVELAEKLNIEPPNILFKGEVKNKDDLMKLLDTESILGNVKIEGIVIKNYNQTYTEFPYINLYYGFPLCGKIVSADFREVHQEVWGKLKRPFYEKCVEAYVTEARIQKAIQRMTEEGIYEGSKRDLRYLPKYVIEDILEEHEDEIKQKLWEEFFKKFKKKVSKKVVRLYLNKMLDDAFRE